MYKAIKYPDEMDTDILFFREVSMHPPIGLQNFRRLVYRRQNKWNRRGWLD
jgi:hypothetical protein